jgi:dUTP pyrophosphatase
MNDLQNKLKSNNIYNCNILKLFIHPENIELLELYRQHIDKHNNNMFNNLYFDAGFDIFIPEKEEFLSCDKHKTKMINMQIKCEMMEIHLQDNNQYKPFSFFCFPRSSISKTPLILANHTGIIDSTYRGNLIGAFRNLDIQNNYTVEKYTRLLQICHPSLSKFFVILVDSEHDLTKTMRGDGGFGSTGV